MKLLILAQTPPPVHGQSLAVEALLRHLRTQPEWEIYHVNLPFSRDLPDVGRWRWGKIFSALAAAARVWGVMLRQGRMPIYYVPAPPKRIALYRDWLLLGLCRPIATGLVLHWHGVGLGAWLKTEARWWERAISRGLLGRAALAIAQAEAARTDCEELSPRRCVVVRNGVPDIARDWVDKPAFGRPVEVLFVGMATRTKGLFDALEGVALANAGEPGAFRLTAVGGFSGPDEQRAFAARAAELGAAARHLGFVSDEQRNQLLRAADIFCFPSFYPHEGQPAVLLQAMCHDLPIVTTRWRGIPEALPAQHAYLVDPRAPEQIAAQLRAARAAGPPHGAVRRHYLAHFTQHQHLTSMIAALQRGLTRTIKG